jgi:hypothetical protein
MLDAGGPQRSEPLSAAGLRDAVPTPTPSPTPEVTPSPTPSPKPKPPRNPRLPSAGEWKRVPARDDVPTFERTFTVVGGTVTLRCSSVRVDDVKISPRPGYRDSIQRANETTMRVSLATNKRVSRIFATWREAEEDCYAEIIESV